MERLHRKQPLASFHPNTLMPQTAHSRWFGVRKDLSKGRAAALMAASFLLPLGAWAIAAYGPFWEVAYQVSLSAESPHLQVVHVPGEKLTADSWQEFLSAVQSDNAAIIEAQSKGTPNESSARQNKKVLRQIVPAALANGWIEKGHETDDEAIRNVWQQLAAGELTSPVMEISDDNSAVIKSNAAVLSAAKPDWPTVSLLKLLPQAETKVSRPVYLIPPHEVALAGWKSLQAVAPEPHSDSSDASDRKTLLQRYGESLRTIFLGFLLGAMVAVPLGILAGTYDFFSKLFEPFIDFFRYMPAPAFGVVLMAIFGLELGPKIMLVFLGTFPHAVLMVANTTRQLEKPLLEAAQTLGANQRQLVTRVVIPGIMPNLYNDLRILLGWAWTWLVIAELMGFKSGLTEIIDTRGRRFQFEHVYPAILLIGISGFITDQILSSLSRVFFPWTHSSPSMFGRFIGRVTQAVRGAIDAFTADREPSLPRSKTSKSLP